MSKKKTVLYVTLASVFVLALGVFSIAYQNMITANCSKGIFETLLKQQPVHVVSTNYLVNEGVKTLYPDFLQAAVKNDTDQEITFLNVTLCAYNKDNYPINIVDYDDLEKNYAYYSIEFPNVSIKPNEVFGYDTYLLQLAQNNNIAYFKAIVAEYETEDGDKWKNPYLDTWIYNYVEVKYNIHDHMSFKLAADDQLPLVMIKDEFDDNYPVINEGELTIKLNNQENSITGINYQPIDETSGNIVYTINSKYGTTTNFDVTIIALDKDNNAVFFEYVDDEELQPYYTASIDENEAEVISKTIKSDAEIERFVGIVSTAENSQETWVNPYLKSFANYYGLNLENNELSVGY